MAVMESVKISFNLGGTQHHCIFTVRLLGPRCNIHIIIMQCTPVDMCPEDSNTARYDIYINRLPFNCFIYNSLF